MSNMGDDNRALTYAEMMDQNLFIDAVVKSSSGREWNIHKVVMSRAGRFFSNAFTFPSFSGTLDLAVSDEIVQVIVDLAYEGKCGVDEENVLEILSAAFMYQMESLIEMCVTFLLDNTISPENVFDLKEFVRKHQGALETLADGALIETVNKFIRRNFIDLYERDEVYKLSVEELKTYIQEDDLNIAEEDLLLFVLKYIAFHQLNNEEVKELLSKVRIVLIDPQKVQQIADENETFRIEMKTKGSENASHLPRYPRDIVLVIDEDENEMEIFNVRKNEWKQVQLTGIEPKVIVGNILYEIVVFDDGWTEIKSFNVKNGHFMTEKRTQVLNDMSDLKEVQLLAWNGGILAFMGDRDVIDPFYTYVAYYNLEENSGKPFPSTKGYRSIVVNGNIFSIGEADEENGLGQVIEYLDTDTMAWNVCGHLKGNPSTEIDLSIVDGKVYAFPWSKNYGECFQPVWEDGKMKLVWFPDIQLPFQNDVWPYQAVVDNKILFTGGEKEDGTILFCPRTGEWSQLADLHGSNSSLVFALNTSEFDVARIEQICNGELLVSDDQP